MDHPYFINPDIDTLPNATGEQREKLVRHIAACVGDESALRAILGIDPEEFSRFYPDMNPAELSTEETISTFINRFANDKEVKSEEIEQLIVAPAVDYASMMEAEAAEMEPEGEVHDATEDAISSFLKAVPVKKPKEQRSAAPQPDMLSEELFKLMVKNKNYDKALEIISELSLKNPKKSVYFAYQIRFLRNLIKNEGLKKGKVRISET